MKRVVVVLAVMLSGCGVIQAQQGREAEATAANCIASIYNSPANAPIRAHLPLDSDNATLTQLSDQNVATPEEVQAINVVYPALVSCRNEYVARVGQIVPAAAPIMQNNYYKMDNDVVALTQQRISWGELIQRNRANKAERQTQLAAVIQQIKGEQAQRFQNSMQALSGLGVALMNYGAPSRLPPGATPMGPTMISCTTMSYQTNCMIP